MTKLMTKLQIPNFKLQTPDLRSLVRSTRARIALLGVVTAVILAGGAYCLLAQPSLAAPFLPGDDGAIAVSGVVEVEQVAVVAEVPGPVAELLADEGDEVRAGDVVIRLDDELLQVNAKRTAGYVELAKANLAMLEAAPRPEEVLIAQSQLRMAEAKRDGAQTAWENAVAARDNPQELNLKIAAAEAELDIAEKERTMSVGMAHTGDDALELVKSLNARVEEGYTLKLSDMLKDLEVIFDTPWGPWEPTMPSWIEEFIKFDVSVSIDTPGALLKAMDTQAQLGDFMRWIAWEELAISEIELEGKEKTLAILRDMRNNPHQASLEAEGARVQYDLAEAEVLQAKARLDAVQAGTSKEDLDAARAQVQQAEAAHKGLLVRIEKMALRSPRDGIVLSRDIRLGEIALPGSTLMTVGNLDRATLTVYVDETHIGRVYVGQAAAVTVDSFPGRTFEGQVTHIASQAEFTPRSVQTEDSRTSMVFAVRIAIDNTDHALKPGMPADAVLR